MSLVSYKRSLIKLSEHHVFHSNSSRNEDTVRCQIMKKIVFCSGWTSRFHWLISPKRLEIQKWAWSHSKELLKSFQNLMYFIQFDLEIKTQCIVKVWKKSIFVQAEPVIFIGLHCSSLTTSNTELGLVSLKRTFEKLSEAHEFYFNWSRNEDTVHSQSMKKTVFCSGWTNPLWVETVSNWRMWSR